MRLSTGGKLIAIMATMLAPLGLIALLASVESAHSNRVARQTATRLVVQEGAGRVSGAIGRLALALRATATAEGRALRRAVGSGEIGIVVGTQGLAGLRFQKLGLAVIDEEQRFGEGDKAKLTGMAKHVLTMTATPHLTGGVPDGTEAISGVQTLSRGLTNAAGQTVASIDPLARRIGGIGSAGIVGMGDGPHIP